MSARIIALHGFTMNGEEFRRALGGLGDRLAELAPLITPDAPHTCSAESVERLNRKLAWSRAPAPALMWWSASDDGSVYDGFDTSLEVVRQLLTDGDPPVVLGFSQGAMFAAAIAALSELGQLPKISAAVMIAGALPRARTLLPLFAQELSLPSLHVAGDADRLMGDNPERMAARFGQSCLRWPGGHAVPHAGAAAEAIVAFVARYC